MPLLVFIVIMAKPKLLSSNLLFIELYHQDIVHSHISQKFTLFQVLKEGILNFSYKDLFNINEDEYNTIQNVIQTFNFIINCFHN